MPARKKRTTAKRKATTRKKSTARRSPKRKATRRTAPKRKAATTAIRTALNKSQLMTHIADTTELSKKQVGAVFEEMANLMRRHLRKGGAGEFTVPGLMKCVVKRKPATKSRRGINPFTGEMITFKAKPARNVVKIRTLKRLKEMVK
jgi:nucleoid DNA-binding protein